jgi:nucleoid-associated protein YgaU
MRNTLLILAALGALFFVMRHRGESPAGPPAGAPAGGGASLYVVRRGDTLWGIAKRYLPSGSSDAMILRYVRQIATANGLSNPDLIFPDQELSIPVYA